jgi:hypothetical protein
VASDITITGADKFAKVAKALKQAGDKELRKELYSGINRATKPMRAEAKKSAERKLPHAGGLNKRVARARLSTRRRAGRNPGVKIVATGMSQLALMDKGRLRHPVWGNRGRWVNQPIPEAEGWFTEPMQDGAPVARREIVRSLDQVAKKLARRY